MAQNNVNRGFSLLVIGGSAGSLEAMLTLLPALNKAIQVPIIIILHRKSTNDTILVDLLITKTGWKVKEAEEKEAVKPGTIYIAPADYHLLVEKDHTFSLDASEKINYSRPSIDVTFESAADVYGASMIAILLSGANADGAAGLKKVKETGGLCIVQDPDSAEVDYMPRQALLVVEPDRILKAGEMAFFLNSLPYSSP